MLMIFLQQTYAQVIIRLPTTMGKNVVGTALTKILLESPLKAPPVTMTSLIHVKVEYAHQVSILLATKWGYAC